MAQAIVYYDAVCVAAPALVTAQALAASRALQQTIYENHAGARDDVHYGALNPDGRQQRREVEHVSVGMDGRQCPSSPRQKEVQTDQLLVSRSALGEASSSGSAAKPPLHAAAASVALLGIEVA